MISKASYYRISSHIVSDRSVSVASVLLIGRSLVRFPWSACPRVLEQISERQTAPDVLVGTLHGSHHHQWINQLFILIMLKMKFRIIFWVIYIILYHIIHHRTSTYCIKYHSTLSFWNISYHVTLYYFISYQIALLFVSNSTIKHCILWLTYDAVSCHITFYHNVSYIIVPSCNI